MAVEPVPILDLKAEYAPIRDEIMAEVARIFDNTAFTLGPTVEAFERAAARYVGSEHAIGVSSGTDAVLVALQALNVGPDDEVITTPYTFFATAASVMRLGARPVFVDVDPESLCIDPEKVAEAITPRTRAILPVHLYGRCADMTALCEVAGDISIVEDAAQALGAEWHGRKAGSIGVLGCFSFYPTKTLGAAGEAGLVSTNVPGLAGRVRILRHQGQAGPYRHELLGGNFRIDALQAAVLSVKLPYLDQRNAQRAANAERYRKLFADAGLAGDPVRLPENGPGKHVYSIFNVRVPAAHRNALMDYLRAEQIGCAVHYPMPLHLQTALSDLGYGPGDFPHSEQAAAECLALPLYPTLSDAQAERVVDVVRAYFEK